MRLGRVLRGRFGITITVGGSSGYFALKRDLCNRKGSCAGVMNIAVKAKVKTNIIVNHHLCNKRCVKTNRVNSFPCLSSSFRRCYDDFLFGHCNAANTMMTRGTRRKRRTTLRV